MADTHYLMAKGTSFSGNYKVVRRSNAANYRKQDWEIHGSGSEEDMQGMKDDWDQWHRQRMQRLQKGDQGQSFRPD